MPIRLNLLAEAHAAEELRRRDPVKRVIWGAVGVVVLVLAWSSSLQLRVIIAKGELNRLKGQIASNTNAYSNVLANQKKLAEINHKLASLTRLATNRFLQAPVLNALQQATTEDIQLLRLRCEQSYSFTTVRSTQTNKPPAITEKIVLTLEGKDTGAAPGDQITNYRQGLSSVPYFQNALGKTNVVRLTNLGAQQIGPDGRSYVQFTLECRYPERMR